METGTVGEKLKQKLQNNPPLVGQKEQNLKDSGSINISSSTKSLSSSGFSLNITHTDLNELLLHNTWNCFLSKHSGAEKRVIDFPADKYSAKALESF